MIYFVLAITAISLLLYLTESSWGSVLSAKRNDLVFENRLQEYGAYQIRKDHPRTMFIALFLSTGGALGLGWALTGFSNEVPKLPEIPTSNWITVTLDDDVVDMVEQKKAVNNGGAAAPPQQIESTPSVAQTDPNNVEVVENELVKPWETEPTSSELTVNPNPGTNLGGNGNGTETGQGTGDGEERKSNNEEKVEVVSQILPEFPGGHAAMQAFLKKHFRLTQLDIERGVTGTMWFTFVVKKDGSVANVTLARGIPYEDALAERAMKVIQSMPKWKPGMNGKDPVNVRYSIPIRIEVK